MKIGISISIDVTKIDKSRLFKGAKGTYMDVITFVDLDQVDQYGNNGFISQSQTKEEREAGAERTPILGNSKVFYRDDGQQQAPQQGTPRDGIVPPRAAAADFEDLNVPF